MWRREIGLANLTVNSGHAASVTMTMAPALSDIKINSFSGRVQYTFSDFNIPDIDINDLPDLLSDPETSVTLANPQALSVGQQPRSQLRS